MPIIRLTRQSLALLALPALGVLPPGNLSCAVAAKPIGKIAPVNLPPVNPFVGTAEHGHTFPGATVPFGMVQLSPDTRTTGWDGSSGYHYSDSTIEGFSHTHLSGTGVGDLGDLLVMPTVGALRLTPGTPGNGYMSSFSHQNEKASPGYYKVFLDTPKVTAELTASARCGFHKYTFPASDDSHIILDLTHGIGNEVYDATVTVENKTTISGYRKVHGWAGDRSIYFVMEFSRPFDSSGIAKDDNGLPSETTAAQGKNLKAYVSYKTKADEVISVRVGISGTGIEGARKNLTTEMPGWDFDVARNNAEKQWADALNAIKVDTTDEHVRTTFYSNLYLSLLSPVTFNDVDKTYRGMDHQNKTGATFENYTTFSLWDTFRAQHPLLTIVQPKRVGDMVHSLYGEYTESGFHNTPVWPLWGNETWCMIGYHSAPVIVDAYLKGFGGFDPETAYQALKDTAMQDRNGLSDYKKYGYIVSTGNNQSVSRTLEYAYDDWCIAQMAQKLGHTEDAQFFLKRAANYRNVFDGTAKMMRGRKANGDWRAPFNPKQLVWADYTEANSWQYTWTVMQDVPGLINIMGGDSAFTKKLDTMFEEKSDVIANIPDITGLIGQYAHGNEPVHHAAYLYTYAGDPAKTAERIRQIATTLYNDGPAGQCGNNDCGQMSAWYVFSAMGFYPVNPVGGNYVFGSPLVNKATIDVDTAHPGTKTFTMVADNNSPKNIYIQSATLNGKPLNRSWITHQELTAGGELHLVMGSKPTKGWGQSVASRPPSGMPKNYQYAALPAPYTQKTVVLSLPIRVACGSDDPIQNFVPDPNIQDGMTNGSQTKIDTSVANAAPSGVYENERYASDFTHSFAVPAGRKYTVRLHFAEIFDSAANERLENIHINGNAVLKDFDIFTVAGGMNKAVVKEFTGIQPDSNGTIKIRVMAAPNSPDQNAKINGIEILPE